MQMSSYLIFLGGLAALVSAVGTTYVVVRKRGPETTNIQITSANTLTEIAVRSAGLVETQRNDLISEVRELKNLVVGLNTRVQEAERKMGEAETRAAEAEAKVLAAEDRERALQLKVQKLERAVAVLQEVIRSANLKMPEGIDHELGTDS